MKVAFDISPKYSPHKVRGIGSYVKNLADEFKKNGAKEIEFSFFKNSDSPPPADIIHYPYFDLFFKTLHPKVQNGKVIVTIHDVIPLIFPEHFPVGLKGNVSLFFQKRALRNVEAVITDSKTSREDIASKLSYPKERIHVIYLAPGINFKKFEKKRFSMLKSKFKLPNTYALYVGDVNWNKNLLNLLEAIKIANIHLVMVGAALEDENLDHTKKIDDLIKKLDIETKVTRTGYVDENVLIALYNLAGLTVLPSFYEGFGLPVLESMACGTPVICSNVASLAEIGGDSATYCDPADPQDIAEKITGVLKLSPKEKLKLSEKSQKHAALYTWSKVARETINVYKSLA